MAQQGGSDWDYFECFFLYLKPEICIDRVLHLYFVNIHDYETIHLSLFRVKTLNISLKIMNDLHHKLSFCPETENN